MVENTSNLTKTKAKKILFISFDKNDKNVLKEIKKDFSNVILTKVSGDADEKTKFQLEFSNPKKAKEAKTKFATKFDSTLVKIESALQQKKKENVIIQKSKLKEEKKSGTVFEINVPKIILRNLSFQFTEETLKTEMEKYGKVKLVSIPKKEDGKMKGFGFAVFESMKTAKKAIEDLNSDKKLLGKKVVADWCLPKRLYQKNERDKENFETNDKDESNDEKDSQDESEEEDDEDEEPKEDPNEKFKSKVKEGTKDVKEKRTVFVRNLSYDVTEESVKECFSKFGPIKYVKLCYDRELERPKGTCFIQFESDQSALNACAESEIMEMDFRTLHIDLAVSRDQVNHLIEDKKLSENQPADNRNLSLAKIGVIYPNSYEAEGLSKADLAKRQKLEAMNTDKLKLLHHFVSPTRLSVHNIPIKITDQELREIFMKAINELPGKTKRTSIIECRIMRDMTRVSSNGVCKSKGYGFVEFTSFELAKKALYATNNNPDLFPNGTRLIVQFSIEDMRALKKKKERIEKSQVKNKNFKTRTEKIRPDNVFEDDFDSKKKLKEKNLIKVHMLERKLTKRKTQEDSISSKHAPKNKKFKKFKK